MKMKKPLLAVGFLALLVICGQALAEPGATSNPIVNFRQTATASAVALATAGLSNGMICKALSSNSGTINVGGSSVTTSNGYPLAAGEAISFGNNNSANSYIVGNGTDVIACVGN